MATFLAVPLAANVSFLQTIDWSKPSWDLVIVLFIVVGALLYGSALGRDRIMVNMVALYMAIAVMKSIPASVTLWNGFIIQLSAFVVLIALFAFLLSRSALQRTIASTDTRGPWWQTFIYSILQIGLFVSVVLSLLPKSSLAHLQLTTQQIFIGSAGFAWIIAPILIMAALGGGAKQKDKKYKYDL
ncbi:MAG: hypothetical protein V1778_01385 [bacterium]